MKVALVLAFALLALSLPASAAAATPEETSMQAFAADGAPFLDLGIKPMPGRTPFGDGPSWGSTTD